MISDLSPGDRLSLKGKLFELQKKLNIIDIEHRLDEQFSFQPKILDYDLPNRQKSFLENSTKADIIRKQKKKMLQESLALQSEESCTFAPQIYTSNKYASSLDNRPVHVRLSEKAKVYQDSMDRKRAFYDQYDDSGNRLFQPQIKSTAKFSKSITSMDSSKFDPINSFDSKDHHNTIGVDEYLYQDAKEREFRLQNLVSNYEQELQNSVNCKKVNEKSSKLLKRKMEKCASQMILLMGPDSNGFVEYPQVVKFCEKFEVFKVMDTESRLRNYQLFWNVLNFRKKESVHQEDVHLLFTSCLQHKSQSAVASILQQNILQKGMQLNEDNYGNHEGTNFERSFRENELRIFRDFIEKISIEFNKSRDDLSTVGDSTRASENETFKPKIHKISYKLAEHKERKDLALLNSVLQASNLDSDDDYGEESQVKPSTIAIDHNNHKSINGIKPADEKIISKQVKRGGVAEESTVLSSSTCSTHPNSHHELLLARGVLQQKKKEKLIESLLKEELADCTFQPVLETFKKEKPAINEKLAKSMLSQSRMLENSVDSCTGDSNGLLTVHHLENPSSPSSPPPPPPPPLISPLNTASVGGPVTPAHERLYALRDYKPKVLSEILPSDIQQLQHCTFAPKVHPPPPLVKSKVAPIPAFEKSVQRMRESFQVKEKEKFEQSDLAQQKSLEDKYRRSRMLSKQGTIPFNFELEKRQQDKIEKTQKIDSKPDLIVEVKLSASKTARIPVKHGDNPYLLAKKFAKIYSLDDQAVEVLNAVLKQSMDSNGIRYTVGARATETTKEIETSEEKVISDEKVNHKVESAVVDMPQQVSSRTYKDSYQVTTAPPRKHHRSFTEAALFDFGGHANVISTVNESEESEEEFEDDDGIDDEIIDDEEPDSPLDQNSYQSLERNSQNYTNGGMYMYTNQQDDCSTLHSQEGHHLEDSQYYEDDDEEDDDYTHSPTNDSEGEHSNENDDDDDLSSEHHELSDSGEEYEHPDNQFYRGQKPQHKLSMIAESSGMVYNDFPTETNDDGNSFESFRKPDFMDSNKKRSVLSDLL